MMHNSNLASRDISIVEGATAYQFGLSTPFLLYMCDVTVTRVIKKPDCK